MTLTVTILGCGASAGVPMIGCNCDVCTSRNNKNKRLRASIKVEKGADCLLVDTSPDLRAQALANDFKRVDAILITHAHADHCHGLDDVRSFNYHTGKSLPLFSDAQTLEELKQRFGYIFQPPAPQGWYRASLTAHAMEIDPAKPVQVTDEISVIPFLQIHGKAHSIGIRIDNFAYSTDVNKLSENSLQALENLDLWIVDCLSPEPAPSHAHLALTLEWIERVKPRRAILTHMGHRFEYETLKSQLPEHIEPAYDGMVICV